MTLITLVMLNMILVMGLLIQVQSTWTTFFMVSMCYFKLRYSFLKAIRFKDLNGVSLRSSLRIFGFSAPLMILLFIFFPRLSGPLIPNPVATKPEEDLQMKCILCDRLPRAIDRLVFEQDSKTVKTSMECLYWRGQEFERGDGMSWAARTSTSRRGSMPLSRFTQEFCLSLALETGLFGLDTPLRLVIPDYRLQATLQKPSLSTYSLKQPW